jgi:hypothetical protein
MQQLGSHPTSATPILLRNPLELQLPELQAEIIEPIFISRGVSFLRLFGVSVNTSVLITTINSTSTIQDFITAPHNMST